MKKINTSMLIAVLLFLTQITNAQNDTSNYTFKDFHKLKIENINGEVDIRVGKEYAIIVSGKGKAKEQIELIKAGDQLIIKLKSGFVNNWKEQKPIKINIVMPEISTLINASNADVNIINYEGKLIDVQNNGNGNISLSGSFVDAIEITNNGNGNLDTKNITSNKVNIFKTGNGDVIIKTDTDFNIEMNGNGDIVNYGKGKAVIKKQVGTGKIVYRN